MKKIITSIYFLSLFFHAEAQTSVLFEKNYPEAKTFIGIEADYMISSNAITTAFTNAYLQSKFLDKDLKDGSLEKMKDENFLGSRFNAGVYYRHRCESVLGIKNADCFFSLRDRIHFNTSFPADLFHLYFYGNKPFAGKTADISDMDYQAFHYQQLQFGVMKEIQKEQKSFGYSIAVSALNGQEFLEIKTQHGSMYTDPEGAFIDMNLSLEARQSDTAHTSFGSSNGLGAAADLMFHFTVEDKYTIQFSATDIGFIAWNSHSSTFEVDTNYHFEGVVVNNLLDSIYLDLKSEDDFKEGFKKDRKSESFSTTLPIHFNLSYERVLKPGKLTAYIGGEYFLNADFQPLAYLGGNYFFNQKISAGISFQYGGYGGFHGGLRFGMDAGNGFIFSIGTSSLDGFILPSSSTGQDAFASLKKIF